MIKYKNKALQLGLLQSLAQPQLASAPPTPMRAATL